MNTPATASHARHLKAPPPGRSTTSEQALECLHRAIVTGRLRPGQRVTQEDIAGQLGMSVAPVREALRILEQEGQVTYLPRRGYFVTALQIEDLEEIYELQSVLETRAARRAVETLDEHGLERITRAARDCSHAVDAGDVAAELEANRRLHFAILESPDRPHAMRLIRLLWDSTEAYRALYYYSPAERRRSIEAHDRMIEAVRERDSDSLVAELDTDRNRALAALRELLSPVR